MALTKSVAIVPGSEATATAMVPAELDSQLVAFGLTLFLGGLNAISKVNDPETKREYLIRYIASIANSADTALRSTQMVNQIESSNSKQIVEDLLKSLH